MNDSEALRADEIGKKFRERFPDFKQSILQLACLESYAAACEDKRAAIEAEQVRSAKLIKAIHRMESEWDTQGDHVERYVGDIGDMAESAIAEYKQIVVTDQCVAGCLASSGGDVRHYVDCEHYKESFAAMYEAERARSAKLIETMLWYAALDIEGNDGEEPCNLGSKARKAIAEYKADQT